MESFIKPATYTILRSSSPKLAPREIDNFKIVKDNQNMRSQHSVIKKKKCAPATRLKSRDRGHELSFSAQTQAG
jgi:hypothetical protein